MVHADSSRSGGLDKTEALREFVWGAVAGAVGETCMHPVDTVKTRIQSGGQLGFAFQEYRGVVHAVTSVWKADGARGLYRGVVPGVTGSIVTGATYFGVIETTKHWLYDSRPHIIGPWSHFAAGALGEAVGSVSYVPCEVIKQRMQLQGSRETWAGTIRSSPLAAKTSPLGNYYSGMFHATRLIIKHEGVQGLYVGYFSTLARDLPFAGLQIMFYERLKETVLTLNRKWFADRTWFGSQRDGGHDNEFHSFQEFAMGGTAGGVAAFLTTPMDVVKTRLQVHGNNSRYRGWLHALQSIWKEEGIRGMFRGGLPRVMWFVPSSAITFCVIEALRKQFNPPAESRASAAGHYSDPDSLKSSPKEGTETSTDAAAASMVRHPRHVHDGHVRVR